MYLLKKIKKTAAVVLSAVLVGLFGAAGYYSQRLPDRVTAETADVSFALYPELRSELYSEDCAAVSLFGAIPVKNISLRQEEAPILIAGGKPFGIKLLMEGVMVTGMSDVDCSEGKVCPAEAAGIKKGDIIRLAAGQSVSSNADLQRIISESCGEPVELSISRSGEERDISLVPVYSRSAGAWRGGMWVRDSIAGIGTMTFIDKASGNFAGLGHPVCDNDTGEMIPIHSGEAVPVEITRVRSGETGIPGELHGQFTRSPVYGTLIRNTPSGVYGVLTNNSEERLGGDEFPMGYRQEATVGEAYILSTVSGGTPKRYSAEIEKIDYSDTESAKNMVIRITDPELIEASGGIVQGMSGSPIIQNGKLIGAVTHVFVADPTRGYAVFAEIMYENMRK